MRRADRLFRVVQYLRGRPLTTASQLAKWLEVSPRTVYRDIQALMHSGMPIDGEPGVGYRMSQRVDLPPLAFERDEVEALVLGARMVEAWADPVLAAAGLSALAKIAHTLTVEQRVWVDATRTFVPREHIPPQLRGRLQRLRSAIRGQHRVAFVMPREAKGIEAHCVRPLALFYRGTGWELAAWCESSGRFSTYPIERMIRLRSEPIRFPDEPGKRLADYVRAKRFPRKRTLV